MMVILKHYYLAKYGTEYKKVMNTLSDPDHIQYIVHRPTKSRDLYSDVQRLYQYSFTVSFLPMAPFLKHLVKLPYYHLVHSSSPAAFIQYEV